MTLKIERDEAKNIFFIHSHITELLMNSIIEEKNLDRQSCIVMLDDRHDLAPSSDIKSYKVPFTTTKHNRKDVFSYKLTFWRNHLLLKEVDKFLMKITNGSEYILFLPNTSYRFLQLCSTHTKCRGYFLLEEGVGSYLSLKENFKSYYPQKNFIYNYIIIFLKGINFKFRLHPKGSFLNCQHNKFLGCFCFFEECFKEFPKKQIISLKNFYLTLGWKTTHTEILLFLIFIMKMTISPLKHF